jgi:hypothetical protein
MVKIFRITADHFCAGVKLEDDEVVLTAPILRYMKGWDESKIRGYCKEKGWQIDGPI